MSFMSDFLAQQTEIVENIFLLYGKKRYSVFCIAVGVVILAAKSVNLVLGDIFSSLDVILYNLSTVSLGIGAIVLGFCFLLGSREHPPLKPLMSGYFLSVFGFLGMILANILSLLVWIFG